MIELAVEPWRESAACVPVTNEVSFFPEPDDIGGISRAKAVCAGCPVSAECLTWAIETKQDDGIWGGHTPKERRAIRRRWMDEVRKAS